MTTKYLINGTDTDALYIRKDKFVEGNLWAWGNNTYGQLGDNTLTHKSSPVQTLAGGTNWKQVSGCEFHIGAIKTDGTLWVWGNNSYGQLGDNTQTDKSSPVQTIAGGTNWKQINGGNGHTIALKTDGTLWSWGYNLSGQLGDNTRTYRSSPVQTVAGGTNWKQISAGGFVSTGIKTDGTLWSWGSGSNGQLGNNSTNTTSSPVQTVAGGDNWKQVSNGYWHIGAIKTDGTLWLWGNNSYGQLGDNTIIFKSSPVQTIAGGTNWKQVSSGHYHTGAIKTDGTLWVWGYNLSGELGNNTSIPTSSPVQTIAGGNNWKQIFCSNTRTTAAIKTDGTLWSWGNNNDGQLGDNTQTNKSSPVQTVTGSTNWKQVSGVFYCITAITEALL